PDTPRFTAAPQVVDIAFRPAAQLQGRIVDEHGQAIVSAKVGFSFVTPLPPKVPPGEPSNTAFYNFARVLPEQRCFTNTDHERHFLSDKLPRDCFFWLHVRHPGFAPMDLYAATGPEPLPDLSKVADPPPGPQNPVWTGDINLTLVKPRTIQVQVV